MLCSCSLCAFRAFILFNLKSMTAVLCRSRGIPLPPPHHARHLATLRSEKKYGAAPTHAALRSAIGCSSDDAGCAFWGEASPTAVVVHVHVLQVRSYVCKIDLDRASRLSVLAKGASTGVQVLPGAGADVRTPRKSSKKVFR